MAPHESRAGTHRQIVVSGAGGLRLVGNQWGPEDAPPVLLLHGGGQTRHAWGATAEALARFGWKATTLDLRGHGDSDWAPDQDYSLEAFVADIARAHGELGGTPVLVGASLGGITGLLLAGERKRPSLAALVLVDVATRMEPEGVERIVDFMMAHPDGFGTLDEAADAVAEYLSHRARRPNPEGLRKNLRVGRDGRYRWHWDPQFLAGPHPPRSTVDRERLRKAARRLELPTLLVRGQMSDVLSEEGVTEFLELVPHARYIDVSGAGHMVAGDQNDAFTDAVAGFLTERGVSSPRFPGPSSATDPSTSGSTS